MYPPYQQMSAVNDFGPVAPQAIRPAAAGVPVQQPAYSYDADALEKYIQELFPQREKDREQRYRKAATMNAIGNVFRTFIDAVGAGKGAPVSPVNNGMLKQYGEVMQQNIARQDKQNLFRLQDAVQLKNRNEGWNREDQKTQEGYDRQNEMFDKQQGAIDQRDDKNFGQQKTILGMQAENQKEYLRLSKEAQKEYMLLQEGERRKLDNQRNATRLAIQKEIQAGKDRNSTDKSLYTLQTDDEAGNRITAAKVDTGQIDGIFTQLLNYDDLYDKFQQQSGYTGKMSLDQRRIFVQENWERIKDQVLGTMPPVGQSGQQANPNAPLGIIPGYGPSQTQQTTTIDPNDPFAKYFK